MDPNGSNGPLREGFLVKRGHIVHNWKARWFVLTPDKLLYYKYKEGKRDSCQRGKILLKDCLITCPFLEYENRPRSRSPSPAGSAVVDWLVFMQLTLTRVDALTLASALLEEGFLRTVGLKSMEGLRSAGLSEQFMDDSTALYSFSDSLKKRGSVKAETSLSAVELSGKVRKKGYLLKQGHRRKNWKVRLFVLRSEPAFLHYYDPTRDDITPVGGFSLRGCLVSSLGDNGVPSGVKGNIQGNLFKIITKSDVHYYIQAPSHQEKMDWIDAIREQT
ncbi:pleckstrin-2 [Nematolebias whitei]|uniref:pleckstrin-2 n=1 Tax=Nematolebias whitei TaxID=451745 RepID=UPI001897FEDB|nr:pleckstrin-2 [Nematolebias whitei]